MIGYVTGRLAWLVVVLLGVTALTFALGQLAPGDPAQIALEKRLERPPTLEEIRREQTRLGLDRPVAAQYLSWLHKAVKGDLGTSWVNGDSVAGSLRERLPRTLVLAASALVLSVAIALPLGVLAAHRRNSLADHLCRIGAILGASVPGFLLAYLLILLLAVRLKVLPAFGFGTFADLVLPSLTLAIGSAAGLTRFTRSAVLDVLDEEYMQAAQAKGVGTSALLFRHGLRNASLPIVTVVGLSLGGLVGGAFIVEWIFAWPGMGTLAVTAIGDKDYPIIQGFVLLTATAYVVVNFLTDLAYASLDPRVHPAGRAR